MLKRIAIVAVVVGIVAGCQPRQPAVTPVATTPVVAEPVFQGKYGAN